MELAAAEVVFVQSVAVEESKQSGRGLIAPNIMVKKNKGGRPKAEVDFDQFEKLCALQCTKLEICDYLNITDKTLDRLIKAKYKMSFSEIFKIKRGKGKIALRRFQWRLAETNPAMAIFLGKNYLEQSDKQEIEHQGGVKVLRDDI